MNFVVINRQHSLITIKKTATIEPYCAKLNSAITKSTTSNRYIHHHVLLVKVASFIMVLETGLETTAFITKGFAAHHVQSSFTRLPMNRGYSTSIGSAVNHGSSTSIGSITSDQVSISTSIGSFTD